MSAATERLTILDQLEEIVAEDIVRSGEPLISAGWPIGDAIEAGVDYYAALVERAGLTAFAVLHEREEAA